MLPAENSGFPTQCPQGNPPQCCSDSDTHSIRPGNSPSHPLLPGDALCPKGPISPPGPLCPIVLPSPQRTGLPQVPRVPPWEPRTPAPRPPGEPPPYPQPRDPPGARVPTHGQQEPRPAQHVPVLQPQVAGPAPAPRLLQLLQGAPQWAGGTRDTPSWAGLHPRHARMSGASPDARLSGRVHIKPRPITEPSEPGNETGARRSAGAAAPRTPAPAPPAPTPPAPQHRHPLHRHTPHPSTPARHPLQRYSPHR